MLVKFNNVTTIHFVIVTQNLENKAHNNRYPEQLQAITDRETLKSLKRQRFQQRDSQ